MISKSTLLHLRIPFSFYLMPVFCFAAGLAQPESFFRTILVFVIIHLFLYPASNGFNSYYDKDEESIGGLKKPPPVSKELLYVSLWMDLIAVCLGLFINLWFSAGILIYGLVSKAYSYDKIRLKKYPISSWLIVGFFQGAFTLLVVYQGLTNVAITEIWTAKVLWAAALSSLMLWASYPMTQIYQHKEDTKRGDITLSLLLGIRGTFIFTMSVFGGVGIAYFFYFNTYYHFWFALSFELMLLPVVVYFFFWFLQVWGDEQKADFASTMRLNLISAICMNLFFIALGLLN